MSKIFTVLLTLCIIAGVVLTAGAEQNKSVRDDIQALLNAAGEAFDRKDAYGVAKTATKDAVLHYLDGGEIPMEEWIANSAFEFEKTKSMKSKFQVEAAEAKGDMAVADYSEKHEYVMKDESSHTYKSESKWQVELVKTKDGWRIRKFTQLADVTYRDGKKINEQIPMGEE